MHVQGHGDGDLASPVRYRNIVSLRECFLYFIGLARAGATAVNSMPVNAWVCRQNFKYDVYDYVSDESTGCSPEEPKSSARQKATSARKPQKQNQPSSSIADLESRASRLTLGNHQPSSHRDLPWRRGADVTVHFSDSQQRWYDEDKKRSLDTRQTIRGRVSRRLIRCIFYPMATNGNESRGIEGKERHIDHQRHLGVLVKE